MNMNIKEIKGQFAAEKISKQEFVKQMHEFHKVLFEFSENLAGTEIAKIEIEDKHVIFTSRKTEFHPGGVKFYVDVIDPRVTPIDTFNFGVYEKEDSEMLYLLVSDGDTIFDVGANIGWYSNHLAKKLPASKIYSFEPIPETHEQVRKNIELNQSKNITLTNVALSDKIQTLTFYYSPSITGASSAANITENSNMQKLECKTNTIDHFVKEKGIDKLDFIKCDVEGAEFMVYQGGAESIQKYKPIVFTEMLRKWAAKFNYHPNDIIDFFGKFGYNCFVSHDGKLKKFGKVDENTLETNYFFLHPEKHSAIIKKLS